MKLLLYSIKDTIVGQFMSPAQFNNDNEAIRAVKYSLKSINNLSTNCKDYELWCIGEYDTETGIIKSDVRHVCNLIDYVDPKVYEAINKPNIPTDFSDELGGVDNG